MNIKVSSVEEKSLQEDEIEIIIKTPFLNNHLKKLIDYIGKFEQKLLINSNNTLVEIDYNDVICFYSDKKYNYCKTKDNTYKIKSKLYEVEKLSSNFIRISKGCIANSNHIKCFDISETGTIIVVFDDGGKEFVSRRRVKSIMEFLDERSI